MLNGASDNENPTGMIQGSYGNFYGTTNQSVFRFTLAGQFTTLETIPLNDEFLPTSPNSPLLQASSGQLYGALTTYSLNQAQFFEIAPGGSGFEEFPSLGTSNGNLIDPLIQASDGSLWTAFEVPGDGASGGIIAFSPTNGAVLRNFSLDGSNGSNPAAIIQGADGKLYGTATAGRTVSGNQTGGGTVWTVNAGLSAPKPSIAAFNSTKGTAGSLVLVRGSNFIGTTGVTFHGTSAEFQVLNSQFIKATVPVAATTGPVSVTNAGGTSVSNSSFIVE